MGNRDGSTIESVDVYLISLAKDKPFLTAHGFLVDEHVFVRLRTKDGVVGWGDSGHFLPAYGGERPETSFLNTQFLAQSLVGRSVFEIGPAHEEWERLLFRNRQAKCALDLAMYDAASRTAGVSLADYLGGAHTDRLMVEQNVAIGDLDTVLSDIERRLGQGIKTLGTKAGKPGSPSIEHDVAAVKAIRKRFGYDFDLWIDFNGGSDRNDAVRAIRELEQFQIGQVEQPVPEWDADGLRYVTAHVSVPVVVDEAIWDARSVLGVHEQSMADIIHCKLPKVGIHGALRVAAMCEATGLPLTMAGFGLANYGQAGLMQFLASQPIALKYAHKLRAGRNVYPEDTVQEVPEMVDGAFSVPTGVGFGIEMDASAVIGRARATWSTTDES